METKYEKQTGDKSHFVVSSNHFPQFRCLYKINFLGFQKQVPKGNTYKQPSLSKSQSLQQKHTVRGKNKTKKLTNKQTNKQTQADKQTKKTPQNFRSHIAANNSF